MTSVHRAHSPGRTVALLALPALLAGCAQQAAVQPNADVSAIPGVSAPVRVFDNIPYRSGASPAWRLDLALPPVDTGGLRPAIVIIHGGGWRAGSRQDAVYQDLLLDYAFQGYVTVSVDYRLTTEAPFPACISDVRCAVKWVRAHAQELRVDPDRIGSYGHSAGAHLSLMVALPPDTTSLDGTDCDWADYSGSVNVAAAGAIPVQPGARQAQYSNPEWWPVNYVSANAPPLLLLQGTGDQTVNAATVDAFVEKLKQAGATDINYVRVDGGTHGVAYDQNLDVTKPAMDEFFRRTLAKTN